MKLYLKKITALLLSLMIVSMVAFVGCEKDVEKNDDKDKSSASEKNNEDKEENKPDEPEEGNKDDGSKEEEKEPGQSESVKDEEADKEEDKITVENAKENPIGFLADALEKTSKGNSNQDILELLSDSFSANIKLTATETEDAGEYMEATVYVSEDNGALNVGLNIDGTEVEATGWLTEDGIVVFAKDLSSSAALIPMEFIEQYISGAPVEDSEVVIDEETEKALDELAQKLQTGIKLWAIGETGFVSAETDDKIVMTLDLDKEDVKVLVETFFNDYSSELEELIDYVLSLYMTEAAPLEGVPYGADMEMNEFSGEAPEAEETISVSDIKDKLLKAIDEVSGINLVVDITVDKDSGCITDVVAKGELSVEEGDMSVVATISDITDEAGPDVNVVFESKSDDYEEKVDFVIENKKDGDSLVKNIYMDETYDGETERVYELKYEYNTSTKKYDFVISEMEYDFITEETSLAPTWKVSGTYELNDKECIFTIDKCESYGEDMDCTIAVTIKKEKAPELPKDIVTIDSEDAWVSFAEGMDQEKLTEIIQLFTAEDECYDEDYDEDYDYDEDIWYDEDYDYGFDYDEDYDYDYEFED